MIRRALGVFGCVLLASCALPQPAQPVPSLPAGSPPPGSCGLALPDDVDDYTAIWTVVAAESKDVVAQDISRLMALWAEDAHITDARSTPADTGDDQTVEGKDAIRYRYTRFVFPSAPGSAQAEDLDIRLLGDQSVVTSTVHIGQQVTPGGNRWRLVKVNGCWLLKELTYNLAPKAGG